MVILVSHRAIISSCCEPSTATCMRHGFWRFIVAGATDGREQVHHILRCHGLTRLTRRCATAHRVQGRTMIDPWHRCFASPEIAGHLLLDEVFWSRRLGRPSFRLLLVAMSRLASCPWEHSRDTSRAIITGGVMDHMYQRHAHTKRSHCTLLDRCGP